MRGEADFWMGQLERPYNVTVSGRRPFDGPDAWWCCFVNNASEIIKSQNAPGPADKQNLLPLCRFDFDLYGDLLITQRIIVVSDHVGDNLEDVCRGHACAGETAVGNGEYDVSHSDLLGWYRRLSHGLNRKSIKKRYKSIR
jgi:hypothetical protein